MDLRNISAWSIRNPVVPIVLFAGLMLAGIVSFMRMEVQDQPDIEFPVVIVQISQPGAAPTEIENQITQLVEAAVQNVEGVVNINSTASEGNSQTVAEFEIGADVAQAVNEVTASIDQIRGELPDGILEPRVFRAQTSSDPIGYFAVAAPDMTIEQLSWFVDDTVTKRLLSIPGLAEVGRAGGVDREILVVLDPARMQSLGVTASQVNAQLRQLNVDAAGGQAEVAGSRQSVRVLGNAETAYELSQLQVPLGGGRTVRLADFATVTDSYSEVTSLAKVAGRQVVTFSVARARGASDVTVFDAATEQLDQIAEENPGVTFETLFTSVPYTKAQYKSSIDAMVEGAVLAVLVVFLFLRDWRATIIAALAIPLSAIPTFYFMDLLGFTLNSLSLLALGLVAGVLVDDAIVEIENIVRHMRMGKTAYQASIDAADEIGLPVVATSFCIVAVFFPVGAMPGISGQFFKNFGFTVVVAVLMSLAVARMITPMLAAYFLKAHGAAAHGEGPMMDRYMNVLRWSLDRGKMYAARQEVESPRRRWLYILSLLLVVLGALAVSAMATFTASSLIQGLELPELITGGDPEPRGFVKLVVTLIGLVQLALALAIGLFATLAFFRLAGFIARLFGSHMAQAWQYLYARFLDHRVWMLGVGYFSLLLTILLFGIVPSQFQPNIDDENSRVEIEMVPGTTLETTERVTDQVADILYEQQEVELALERVREGQATLYVTLKPDRERSSIEFERALAPTLAQIPDARVRFASQSGGFGSGRDMTVMLAGSDPDLLNETAATLVEQMKSIDMLVAPRISADINRPELIIEPREDIAAELGVTTVALSQTIRIATMGEIEQNAAKFSLSDRQIPIRVKLPERSREDLDTIKNLPVQTASGGSVPLSRVADVSFGSGPTTIQRYNQNRRVLVGADLAQGVVKGEAQAEIDALPVLQDLPQGVIRDVVGEDEWQQELVTSLGIAIVSGVLLVFAVLVLLYKRLMSPLVNMTSLALAPLGGILLVWLFGQPQSMPVYIGILLLLGIVSKNSILLIDFAIEEMDKGTRKLHAIIDAGHKRAQPIVMTTVAMTAGMVPTALSGVFGGGDGAWRAPMGTVVIGGLILSTMLTLLIVPAGFSLADGFEKRVGPWLRTRMLTYKEGDDTRGIVRNGSQEPGVEPAE